MINLIRNELTKISKKKSIYITLLVTLIFIIITNVIYTIEPESYGPDVTSEIEFYEEQLQHLDPNVIEQKGIYINYSAELEMAKLIQKYGGYDTWQAEIVKRQGNQMVYEMLESKYDVKDEEKYNTAKEKYDEFVKKLDTGDWKYFVSERLKEIEQNIKDNELQKNALINQGADKSEIYAIEEKIAQLELSKQILNWRLEKDICYDNSYQDRCLYMYESAKNGIRSYETTTDNELNEKQKYENKKQYYYNLEKAEIAKYDIENKTEAGDETNARGVLLDAFSQFEIFIIIMSVMIAGTIISEEFNKGTIKLLLIKPYKRVTILTAKFITTIIMLIIIIILVMLMQFVVGGIVQGFDSFGTPAVIYNHTTNQIEEISIIKYLCMQAVGKMPIYILLMTLAFAFSTLFTNSALAIAISLLGSMGAPMINMLAQEFNLTWIKFFVTPNWDLTQYFFGGLPEFMGLTLGFSIVIILIYMVIMLVPSYVVFKKRNIKNI